MCKCGESFVDQTEWYTRLGGYPEVVDESQK